MVPVLVPQTQELGLLSPSILRAEHSPASLHNARPFIFCSGPECEMEYNAHSPQRGNINIQRRLTVFEEGFFEAYAELTRNEVFRLCSRIRSRSDFR